MKIFNKNNFMIHSLVAKDAEKYKSGIHVTSDFTEVTDGVFLIRVYSKEAKEEDVPETDVLKPLKEEVDLVIPAGSAKEIEKAIPKKQHPEILNHTWVGENTNNETAEFICTDLEEWKPIVVKKSNAHYPDTDRIISDMAKDRPEAEIQFNPEYMEKICQQFRKAKIARVKLSIYDPRKAMEIEGDQEDDSQKIVAVLMPRI